MGALSPSLGTRRRCLARFLNNLERRGAGAPARLPLSITRRFPCCPGIPGQCQCPCTAPQVPSSSPPAPSIPRAQGRGGLTPNPSLIFSFLVLFLHGSMGMAVVGTAGWPGAVHPLTLRCDGGRGKGERKKKAKKHPAGAAQWPPASLPRVPQLATKPLGPRAGGGCIRTETVPAGAGATQR